MEGLDYRGIGMTSQRTRERLVGTLQELGIADTRVLDAIRSVPRHVFVDEALASRAYENTALPIGFGQTISQPYTVARMTQSLLAIGPLNKVLEVGTGSGYQTAVLSSVAGTVFSVERIAALQEQARERFRGLGLRNIRLHHGDGGWGWEAHAPYDGILVTAAAPEVPEALLAQLADGGRLLIPVGTGDQQQLLVITRRANQYEQETLERVHFVPLLKGAS